MKKITTMFGNLIFLIKPFWKHGKLRIFSQSKCVIFVWWSNNPWRQNRQNRFAWPAYDTMWQVRWNVHQTRGELCEI